MASKKRDEEEEEKKEVIIPKIRKKVAPPPPVYQSVIGLEQSTVNQVPLEHRRKPADLFTFPIEDEKEERDPFDREQIKSEAFQKNDLIEEFSNGFLLGFLFSWAQQRIQSHIDFVRVYTWNPNPLIQRHHQEKVMWSNFKNFYKANRFGLAFGFFSSLMGFYEPLYNRWWGDRGFVPTGLSGGTTSITLAIIPTTRTFLAQRRIIKRALDLKITAARIRRNLPLKTYAKSLIGAFSFGFALMGGIEAILGGPEAPPEEDPELQGYPPLTITADMLKTAGK